MADIVVRLRHFEKWKLYGGEGPDKSDFKEAADVIEALRELADLHDKMSAHDNPVADLDVVGKCFGLRFRGDQVELCVEDDGNWFVESSFSRAWLSDIKDIAERGIKLTA